MPVSIRKTSSGKFSVKTPHGVKAKGTTKEKAEAQKRLLNAVEHGWKPTGKRRHESSVQALVSTLLGETCGVGFEESKVNESRENERFYGDIELTFNSGEVEVWVPAPEASDKLKEYLKDGSVKLKLGDDQELEELDAQARSAINAILDDDCGETIADFDVDSLERAKTSVKWEDGTPCGGVTFTYEVTVEKSTVETLVSSLTGETI